MCIQEFTFNSVGVSAHFFLKFPESQCPEMLLKRQLLTEVGKKGKESVMEMIFQAGRRVSVKILSSKSRKDSFKDSFRCS